MVMRISPLACDWFNVIKVAVVMFHNTLERLCKNCCCCCNQAWQQFFLWEVRSEKSGVWPASCVFPAKALKRSGQSSGAKVERCRPGDSRNVWRYFAVLPNPHGIRYRQRFFPPKYRPWADAGVCIRRIDTWKEP